MSIFYYQHNYWVTSNICNVFLNYKHIKNVNVLKKKKKLS